MSAGQWQSTRWRTGIAKTVKADNPLMKRGEVVKAVMKKCRVSYAVANASVNHAQAFYPALFRTVATGDEVNT